MIKDLFKNFAGILFSKSSNSKVSVEEFNAVYTNNESLVLLDVRNASEFIDDMVMLKNGIHIPLHELNVRSSELEQHKDTTIYVICKSGARSGMAARILRRKGFMVKNIKGGMLTYRKYFPGN